MGFVSPLYLSMVFPSSPWTFLSSLSGLLEHGGDVVYLLYFQHFPRVSTFLPFVLASF